MRIRTVLALAAALLGTAPALTPRGSAVAQAAPAAHQYVVGVSGMH
jgi:hypothetical protein